MSVVAVKRYGDRIEFAADSIAVRGATKTTNNFSKLETINGLVVGGVGYTEEISMLFLFAKTHKPIGSSEKEVMEFMLEFAKWKREFGLDFSSKNNYLIGFENKVFYIENMLVKEIKEYYAIGAGEDYALAVLHLGHSPKESVRVACELCCYVAEPIVTAEIKLYN